MKKIVFAVAILALVSCGSDDDSTSRSSEKIEITIDNGTPLSYSDNIEVQYIPLPPTSGFNGYLEINSENGAAQGFQFSLPKTTEEDYPVPYNVTIAHPVLLNTLFTAQGIDIDYSNPGNSVFIFMTQYGAVGQPIVVTVTGFYYDSSNVYHDIVIEIDVERDAFVSP